MALQSDPKRIADDPAWLDAVPDRTRAVFDLVAFERADGGPSTVPVHVIAGTGAHPRLVAIAGIHGDEPDGMLALLEASRSISPTGLRGRLVLVPIAHPAAFAAGQRRSPLDGLDLNRIFPGTAEGMPTERLAHRLFEMVVRRADFLFTLHSWYATGTVLPFVEVMDGDSTVAAAGLAAARASSFGRIRLTNWPEGLLVRVANEAGVPGMEAEIGGNGAASPEGQRQYRHHLDLLMSHLGMSDAVPSASGEEPRVFRGRHVRSPFAGVLSMQVALGDPLGENAIIAEVTDLHGRPVGTVASPVAGIVVSRRSYGSVAVGDILATVFSPAEHR
jgi:predicted deacylase